MIGCLCLHGFTGSPDELFPLIQYLHMTTDWVIEAPILPGHHPSENINHVTYQEWMRAAEKALDRLLDLCDEVYLIGFSMGGVLAGFLGAKYRHRIKKIVFLSAAVYYFNPIQFLKNTKTMLRHRSLSPPEIFYGYQPNGHHPIPWHGIIEFHKLVKKLKPSFYHVMEPTLIIQGECDGVVPIRCAHELYRMVRAKEKNLHILKNSNHIVCHDVDKEELIDTVVKFLIS